MKHTKGEWYTGETINDHDQRIIASEEKGQTIAICYGVSNSEEAEANAKLIAAAPELLEALMDARQLLGMHQALQTNFEAKAINKILNAINKAQGI